MKLLRAKSPTGVGDSATKCLGRNISRCRLRSSRRCFARARSLEVKTLGEVMIQGERARSLRPGARFSTIWVRGALRSESNSHLSKSRPFADHASSTSRTRPLCCDSGKPVARRSLTAWENSSGVATTSRESAQGRVEGRSRTTTGLPVAKYSFSLRGCMARVTGRSAYGMISTSAAPATAGSS